MSTLRTLVEEMRSLGIRHARMGDLEVWDDGWGDPARRPVAADSLPDLAAPRVPAPSMHEATPPDPEAHSFDKLQPGGECRRCHVAWADFLLKPGPCRPPDGRAEEKPESDPELGLICACGHPMLDHNEEGECLVSGACTAARCNTRETEDARLDKIRDAQIAGRIAAAAARRAQESAVPEPAAAPQPAPAAEPPAPVVDLPASDGPEL